MKFKPLEFEGFKNEAGSNYFVLSPQRRIEALPPNIPKPRVGMARCAVPVAERKRQATERTHALPRLTTPVPPAGRGRGRPSGPSLPGADTSVKMRPVVPIPIDLSCADWMAFVVLA